LERLRAGAVALGGEPLDLADVAHAFDVLPRARMAVLLWRSDEDFPARASILFDAAASHYLPTEDLAGLADVLARRLVAIKT
ncbi:MAG TPA: DUF3786 domain-containing protein, partial [Thermoleophilia bacterium]|nr:DUF3786 domain-containing protein [Thermoleophilia bacterium]